MERDYLWAGDYGNREYLRPILCKLLQTQTATSLQSVLLAINNNPYNLEFYILVNYRTPQENDIKHMLDLFELAGLHRRTDISGLDLINELGNRRFDIMTLLDAESVDVAFARFCFAERKDLEAKGYYMLPLGKKGRVFISHSSKDNHEIELLLPFLNAANIPLWFDKYNIEVGESILNSVQTGIESSSTVVFWITKNFLESKWCQHEMNAFIRKLIEEDAKIISILDSSVSAKDLPTFLRDIKYIERQGHSIEELSKIIIQMLRVNPSPNIYNGI